MAQELFQLRSSTLLLFCAFLLVADKCFAFNVTSGVVVCGDQIVLAGKGEGPHSSNEMTIPEFIGFLSGTQFFEVNGIELPSTDSSGYVTVHGQLAVAVENFYIELDQLMVKREPIRETAHYVGHPNAKYFWEIPLGECLRIADLRNSQRREPTVEVDGTKMLISDIRNIRRSEESDHLRGVALYSLKRQESNDFEHPWIILQAISSAILIFAILTVLGGVFVVISRRKLRSKLDGQVAPTQASDG
jgi:hypothetical protein